MATKPNKQPKRADGQSMPVQTRSADISNVNEDDRSFELVWTTGAKVRRYDWWREEYYDEELVVSDNAVDLTRLNNGAPLLDMHSGWSLRSILGVVEKAWIAAGEGLARVRFPRAEDNPDADRVFRMIKDKIIRNVSVGYRVNKIERERQDDGPMLYRVIDWQPFEISIVTVPADAGAGIRSEDQKTYPVIFVDRAAPDKPSKESPMEDEDNKAPAQAEPTQTRTVDPTPPATPAAAPAPAGSPAPAEQARAWSVADMTKVTARAAAFGLSADIALEVMGTARNLDEATDALQARAAERNAPRQTAQTRVLTDEGDTKRRAIEVAVLHRANQNAVELTDAAREYRGMSLLEMGRAYLEDTQGIRLRGLNKRELASTVLGIGETRAGMLSTSDFPKLLGNVVGARLRDAYGTAVKTWPIFCRQNNAPDFKERAIVQLAGIPEFKKVREGGEYTYAKLGESSEKYALGTYGRMIAITRQTLINDDLGAFDRLPTLFGRAAAELENDIVWGIILDNPKMGDGIPLFHADHGNLTTAGLAPAEASLEAMDIAMGEQQGAEKKPLNLRPKFLIVSRKHKVTAQKLLTSVTAAKTGDVNVYQNSLDLIVEDRLYVKGGASPWLTVVDPATWDTIEYSYLEGEQGLYTEERVGFDVDGIEIKGRLDFAAKAIDWRGFQKNPGQ